MNSFWTVVGFTAKNKFKGKAFLITTIIIALLLSIGLNLPYVFSQIGSNKENKEAQSIGYIQSASETLALGTETGNSLQRFYEEMDNPPVLLKPYEDAGSAEDNEALLRKAIRDGDISGYLSFGGQADSGFPEMTYKSEKLMDFSTTSSLQGALQMIRQVNVLEAAGLSSEQLDRLNAPIKVESMQISAASGETGGKDAAAQGVNMGLNYAIIIFLFMAIVTSGQLIATEITAEKSSRVMEILITSVSPLKQMFGKIFGMFVVVLAQLSVYVAITLINLALPHNKGALKELNIDLSSIDPLMLFYVLIFFLAGFFLFATLYAAVGSIVSRTEDLGQATLPMTLVSLAGFYIAMFSLTTPDSVLVKITSYVPLFSPFVMVLRLGLTPVPLWEVLLSILLLLVTIYIAVYACAKIYRTGVLMYGKRPSWKEIRKAMKAYKI